PWSVVRRPLSADADVRASVRRTRRSGRAGEGGGGGNPTTDNGQRTNLMSRSANVQSIQTLKDFKLAMIAFGEDARNALSGVEMDLRKMRDWLERDQLGYWQMQIKRRDQEVMQARADLHRRKISQQGSDAVSDSEQKEALREAMKRLRFAEEKVALIKRLI